MSEIAYFPDMKIEHETEKAIYISFLSFPPARIEKLRKRYEEDAEKFPALRKKLPENLQRLEEREYTWIPK